MKHKQPSKDVMSKIRNEQDLRGIDLSGIDLTGVWMCGKNLGGANLSGARLSGANLRGSDLTGADIRGAALIDTCFDDAICTSLKDAVLIPVGKDALSNIVVCGYDEVLMTDIPSKLYDDNELMIWFSYPYDDVDDCGQLELHASFFLEDMDAGLALSPQSVFEGMTIKEVVQVYNRVLEAAVSLGYS